VRHSFRGYIERKHIGRLTKEIYKGDLQSRLTKETYIGRCNREFELGRDLDWRVTWDDVGSSTGSTRGKARGEAIG